MTLYEADRQSGLEIYELCGFDILLRNMHTNKQFHVEVIAYSKKDAENRLATIIEKHNLACIFELIHIVSIRDSLYVLNLEELRHKDSRDGRYLLKKNDDDYKIAKQQIASYIHAKNRVMTATLVTEGVDSE